MTTGALGAIAQQQAPGGLMPQRPNPGGGMHPVAEQQQKFGAFKGLGETLKGFATSPEGRVFMMGTLASLAQGGGIASPLEGVGTLAKFKHLQRQRSDEEAARAEEQRRYEQEQQTAAQQRRQDVQMEQRRLRQGDKELEIAGQREGRLKTGQAEDRAFQKERAGVADTQFEKEYALRAKELDSQLEGKGNKATTPAQKLKALNDAEANAINALKELGISDEEKRVRTQELKDLQAIRNRITAEVIGDFSGQGAPATAPSTGVSQNDIAMIRRITAAGGFEKARAASAGSPERMQKVERWEAIAKEHGLL